MTVMAMPTTVGGVSPETGERIRERRIHLGMSVKALAERAGVDRGRLSEIEAGASNARATTIRSIQGALDAIEDEMGMNDGDSPAGAGLVEFTIEGNFGVRAVVKGPVSDLPALKAAVADLVRDMRRDGDEV